MGRGRRESAAGEIGAALFSRKGRPRRDFFWARGGGTPAGAIRCFLGGSHENAGGIVGAGFDEFFWPRPVRPGDELRVESEVLEMRAPKSRPDQVIIKVTATTLNQNNEPVQVS